MTGTIDRGRLVAWSSVVGVLALLGYASRAAGGKPAEDVAYQYSTAASGLLQYGVVFTIVLLIARPDWRRLLALRRPSSYRRAFATAAIVLVSVYLTGYIVTLFSDPGAEQGLTPNGWDSHRAAQFAVNFAVFTIVAPVVEELMFRGLGYSLLEPLGRTAAILWVGVAFGLAHGLIVGLPILIVFGAGLALLRARTDSVYPGIVVHSAFNAIALIASVTT